MLPAKRPCPSGGVVNRKGSTLLLRHPPHLWFNHAFRSRPEDSTALAKLSDLRMTPKGGCLELITFMCDFSFNFKLINSHLTIGLFC